MSVTYDSVTKKFAFNSGTTGDTSSLSISGVEQGSLANELLGLTPIPAGESVTIETSAVALRGLPSTPATVTGTPPVKNLANIFSVDPSNNTFQVTIDGIRGKVVVPPRSDYSIDSFAKALQKGINAMGANNAGSDPTTVNGVKVGYDPVKKGFTITSGTAGNDSYVKISGSADWGLANVDANYGVASTWIKPTQQVNATGALEYIDSKGRETTSNAGFTKLPAWSPVYLTKGQLTFSTTGKLISPTDATQLDTVYLDSGKGALNMSVNFGGSTQYGTPFSVLAQSQNGAPEGDLVGVTIGNDGLVTASFSNGTSKSLAKILMANFATPVGLRPMGDSSFSATKASGAPTLGTAGSAGFGTLRSGATERANVDLTQELVDLITAQRNFQANAKAIETSSTMTSAIINLRS
jgi:flagellar hook-basal body protein